MIKLNNVNQKTKGHAREHCHMMQGKPAHQTCMDVVTANAPASKQSFTLETSVHGHGAHQNEHLVSTSTSGFAYVGALLKPSTSTTGCSLLTSRGKHTVASHMYSCLANKPTYTNKSSRKYAMLNCKQ